ncbi:MAG TPA: hypothetical protein VFH50_11490 [Acidimicrobiales bacterium]|nr:hypothetical protein [Acidimicrobiales bacterium]
MSVSPVSQHVHPAATEAAERPGPDHDGDRDDAAVGSRPAPGRPAPGGGIYL